MSKTLKFISICHLLTLLLGGIVCLFLEHKEAFWSYLLGWAVIMANFYLLYWLWKLIIFKKVIALAVLLIVFKYTFLGFITYKLLSMGKIDLLGFSFGIMSIVLTVCFYSVIHNRIESSEDEP